MNYKELIKIVNDINEYSSLMCDEYGEYLLHLTSLLSYLDLMDESFKKEYENEIKSQLNYLVNNTKIVEEEIKRDPIKVKNVKFKNVDY
jgi:hypothetical protein